MSKNSDIKLDYTGIGQLLSSRQCVVPRYQRSYAWEDSHVGDFIQDIQAAMADNEPEYFLGSVVATSLSGIEVEIVDGQQRLATTTIVIAAVRDWFVSEGDEESANTIENEFLFKKDRRTKSINSRLRLNESDNDFFVRRILSRPDEESRQNVQATKGSHGRLAAAAGAARSYVDDVVSVTKHPEERLNDIVDYLQECVRVIWLTTTDESNAFVIFETLNDRGLELAISDLLKNY